MVALKQQVSIVEITNPFEPFRDTRVSQHPGDISVRKYLRHRYGKKFRRFSTPHLVLLNGHPLLIRQWGRKMRPGDVLNITTLPAAPVVVAWIALAVTVAAVVLALTIRIPKKGPGQKAGDSVYTLRGQSNQVKLGEVVPVPYGKFRHWCPYAAQAYTKYENNQQWSFQLFVVGPGEYEILEQLIDDTPISQFQDVTTELIPPGSPVTLFPENVVTSDEVANIELLAPNEAPGTGVPVEDSEGDPGLGIPSTGHTASSLAGPFVINGPGTLASKLEFDVAFPAGLYKAKDNGDLDNISVSVLFEAQEVDDLGSPVGDWFTAVTQTFTAKTNTAQRFTLSTDVTPGRYQVRASRTSNKDLSTNAGNTVLWEACRAFLPATSDYSGLFLWAVKARATNNLNDNTLRRFNLRAIRKLPIYNPMTETWSAPTSTRSPVWAYCDVFRNELYGCRLTEDRRLDLAALKVLADLWEDREEYFDYIFDSDGTAWAAVQLIADVGRAVPMVNGTKLTMIRDEAKSIPSAMFTPDNIVKGSFKWETKLHEYGAKDGLLVSYVDGNTWKEETVLCVMDDEEGENPETTKLEGVTDRTHAYHWGMWRRALDRYVREQGSWQTGLEGHIPTYGDLVGIAHDAIKAGSYGLVLGVADDNQTLHLSDPFTFGVGTYKIMLRKRNGDTTDLITVTAGADDMHVVLATPLDPSEFALDPREEPPLYAIGPSTLVTKNGIVDNLSPSGGEAVEVSVRGYRPEPHTFDDREAPPLGDTGGGLGGHPAVPGVTGLTVTRAANSVSEVQAQWNAARGAEYYLVQLSYDGTHWETISDNLTTTSIRFSVNPVAKLYVRVAGVATGQGPWVYWVGDNPTQETNVVVDTGIIPNAPTMFAATGHFGMIRISFKDANNLPSNKMKGYHIYATTGSAAGWDTMPSTPSFFVYPTQEFFYDQPLGDNVRRNYWIVGESLFGIFSAPVGPISATTINGTSLDMFITGGLRAVELLGPTDPLPSTGNFKGRQVFLQADDAVGGSWKGGRVYVWTGTGTPSSPTTGKASWTWKVDAVNIEGEITETQIADNSISTPKLRANAVGANEIAADSATFGKVVAAAVAASAIGTDEFVANTANIKNGIITNGKIGNLEVGTAKMADLSVSTLKIQDNAVTIPVSADYSGGVGVDASATVTMLSLSGVDVPGSEPVHVDIKFLCTPKDNNTYYLRIKRNGSTIREFKWKCPIIGADPRAIGMVDYPGVGNHSYDFEVYGDPTNSGTSPQATFEKMSMLCSCTKK